MTAILKVINTTSQLLVQGKPKMKGRAVIAYGNKGQTTEQGVVTNNPYGTFGTGAGENQSIGFNAEGDEQFAALGITRSTIFDGSSSMGQTGFFYGTYDNIAATDLEKEHVDSFLCGELDIAVSPSDAPDSINAIIILSSGTMETASGYVTKGGGAGNVSVTGLPFEPGLVFFTRFGHSFFGDPGTVTNDIGLLSIGAADGYGNQWVFGCESIPYLFTGPGSFRSSNCSASKIAIRQDPFPYMSHVSMNSDGFTLNWSAASTDIIQYWAIYDPEGDFKVGMGQKGDASFTPGFKADNVLFATSGTTVLDTNQSHMMIGVGGCDNQLNQMSGWAGGAALNDSHQAHYWNTSAISMTSDLANPLTAQVLEGTVTAVNPTTVDLSWTGTPIGANPYFGWAAMKTGSSPVDECSTKIFLSGVKFRAYNEESV